MVSTDTRPALRPRPGRRPARAERRGDGRGGFWALRQPISRRLRNVLMVVSVLVPAVAWVVLSGAGVVKPLFLPSPAAVARAFHTLTASGDLQRDLGASLSRIGIGFALVVVVSVPLGLLIGTFPSFRALFEPMIGLLRYMPASAFIPLLIVWLGIGETSKIALLFIGTVFFNTLMSADAVSQAPTELIDASYTLGASKWEVLRKVIFPYALPGLIDSMRVNVAATWNLVVVAELFAAHQGLGYRIIQAQRFLHTDQIFAVLIVIGVIGVSIDLLFRLVRNVAAPWAKP